MEVWEKQQGATREKMNSAVRANTHIGIFIIMKRTVL